MQDELLMSVLNCGTDRPKQLDTLLDRRATTRQGDRLPFYKLHHNEWTAIFRLAAVQNCANVGMIQRGEDLPLHAESLHQIGRVETFADHLDRDYLEVMIIRSNGKVDNAHPPAVYLPD